VSVHTFVIKHSEKRQFYLDQNKQRAPRFRLEATRLRSGEKEEAFSESSFANSGVPFLCRMYHTKIFDGAHTLPSSTVKHMLERNSAGSFARLSARLIKGDYVGFGFRVKSLE